MALKRQLFKAWIVLIGLLSLTQLFIAFNPIHAYTFTDHDFRTAAALNGIGWFTVATLLASALAKEKL